MAPRSTRRGDEGDDGRDHSSAAVPLLHDQESHTQRDTRFAISEEDAEAPEGSDEELDHQQDGNKYPPNSLPPSYRDAVYASDPWYKSEVALSLRHYAMICFGSIATVVRRYWPTSRFAQAGFFIAGLWVIVIVTGPTWDKSARLSWGPNSSGLLSSAPPPPLSGDGHYISPANWSTPSCRSTPTGSATYCSRRADFNLTIPAADNSFKSSDSIFVFVDPIRGHGFSDARGRVPATVEVREDGKVDADVVAEIHARYEKDVEPLLEQASVGLMGSGLRDRGIGIYTWPLPPHLAMVSHTLYPYPLLSFRIILHVSPASRVPTLHIDGAEMDVGLFRSLPADGRLNLQKRSTSQSLQILDKSLLDNVRYGHAIGKKRAEQREAVKRKNEDSKSFPYFGIVRLTVGNGDLLFAGSTRTMGRVWAVTQKGKIDIADDTRMSGIELHLESKQGTIQIGKRVDLEAQDIVHITAQKEGDVQLGAESIVSATRTTVESKEGSIHSLSSEWKTNHTLVFKGLQGVNADISISAPDRKELGVGTEQRAWISVETESRSGPVTIRIKDQMRNTGLRGQFKAPKGSADVRLSPEYIGAFHVTSSKPNDSKVSSPKDRADEAGGRDRVFSSENKSTTDRYDVLGEVWWKEHGKSQKRPGQDDWGSVFVTAGDGPALVSFES